MPPAAGRVAQTAPVDYIYPMSCLPDDAPPQRATNGIPDWPTHPEIEPSQGRNLLLLAIHQTVLRVGWIFKTESVIMPAFLDYVAGPGAGMLRGCMPVLNRLGQSVPPVFCAEHLKRMRYKKRALGTFTALMSLPFAALAVICFAAEVHDLPWMPAIFLALYFVFFIFNGLYHLSFSTIQGKLIRPTQRGRLMLLSTFWGALPAMLFAWWLLRRWLNPAGGGLHFQYVFTFIAICFFLSGLVALFLFEPPDEPTQQKRQKKGSELFFFTKGIKAPTRSAGKIVLTPFSDTLRTIRRDANLRYLLLVSMLFCSGLIIFPHYQALANQRLGLTGPHWIVWVIAQNAAVGVYSLFFGPLADRRGNRLTMRTLILASAVAPAFAVSLPHLDGGLGAKLFWIVFVLLGITPLVLRTILNYALEICEPQEHPRYLSTVSLGMAVPFLLSPLVGWMVDVLGFELVFSGTVCLVVLGGLLTFRLDEPRHRRGDDKVGVIGIGADE